MKGVRLSKALGPNDPGTHMCLFTGIVAKSVFASGNLFFEAEFS